MDSDSSAFSGYASSNVESIDEVAVSDIGTVTDGNIDAASAVSDSSILAADASSSPPSVSSAAEGDIIKLDEWVFVDYENRRQLLRDGARDEADRLRTLGREAFVSHCRQLASARSPAAPVVSFYLRLSHPSDFEADVLAWTRMALAGDVQVIEVDFTDPDSDNQNPPGGVLPLEVYSHGESLHTMRLSGCDIDPLRLAALRGLRKLCLSSIQLPPHAVELLAAGCCNLEELTLRKLGLLNYFHFSGQRLERLTIEDCMPMLLGINVNSPRLHHFQYCGRVAPIEIDEHKSLKVAEVDFSHQDELSEHASLLSEILLALKNATDLTVCGYFSRFIATSDMEHSRLPVPILTVQRLTLIKTALEIDELRGISFLLRSYVTLEDLVVQLGGRKEVSTSFIRNEDLFRPPANAIAYWESTQASEPIACLRNYLRRVQIVNFQGSWAEIDFARFILANALLLEEFELVTDRANVTATLSRIIMYVIAVNVVHQLPRASFRARITLR